MSETVSVHRAAQMLGVSYKVAKDMYDSGEFPNAYLIKGTRIRRIPKSDVENAKIRVKAAG